MQNLKLDIDSLIKDLTRAKSGAKIRKKKVPGAPLVRTEIGLSEKFRLITRRNTKETLSVYKSAINRFLRFTQEKEDPDEWDLRRFLENLEQNGFSRSYQRTSWYALKKYFKAKGIDWPLDQTDYPDLDRDAIKKPTLSQVQIRRMIQVVRNPLSGSEANERVFLALTSIYAIRKSEFCSLTENNIDRGSHTLYIKTKKRGESRYHLVPEEIRPYVYSWSFNKRISSSGAHIIFDAILAKAGIQKTEGLGSHALRRGVFTALCSTDLPPMRIYNFGKWKKRELGMLAEYDNPDFRETDRLVFSKHPFLEVWQ